MHKIVLTLFFVIIPWVASAQVVGPINEQFNSIRLNGVSIMASFGDSIWVGPSLNLNIDNRPEWYTAESADSVVNGIGRVFSLKLGKDTVLAGLGFTSETVNGEVPAAYGYYKSLDGGENWKYLDFPLDPRGVTDTTFTYGGITYDRIRITVPEQSPPYDLDFKGEVIFSANWASGLLRSQDFGETWERVVLPPAQVDKLIPDQQDYYWITCTERGENNNCIESVNKYNSVEDDNLKGFGVLIDSQNRVWFGSAGGINISSNALTAPIDSIAWRHIDFESKSDGLLGNWIISIQEEPSTGRIWMTNWIANQPQKQGIVYTEDSGESFTQMLIGERIYNIGFKDGYVFATGDNGLFISPNGGDTWIKSPQIKSPNTFIKSSAVFYSAASTTNRIWISTSDGIASHGCCIANQVFNNWEITRVNFPLKGGNVHDDGRDVNTYAYPNPFSPTVHELVRIKFEVENQGNVNIRVFDFGMHLVREIENGSFSPGTYEAVWDGVDGKGRKVANGAYIYVIETPGALKNGKILVVD
jgi:hypothetical protein